MAEHLLDNIYQVGGETISHELDGVSYLILDEKSPEKSVLIDCGSPLGFDELTQQLNSFDISIDTIQDIRATHGHFDHVAAASLLDSAEVTVSGTTIRALHTPGDTVQGGFESRINSNEQAWVESLDKLLIDSFEGVTFGHGVNYVITNAMAHLALAKSRFMVAPRVSHGGEYINPWQPKVMAIPDSSLIQ